MRSHASIYVDTGYLLASAATRVTGTSLRNGIYVEYGKLVASLVRQAETVSRLPVLRVHWYDSARNGVPDAQQERIGELPKVKLRLGRFGMDGQQKGVDVRMGLDLVAHARNSAADVFFLVSGDDDLTEAVEEAQVHGVSVVLVPVPNAKGQPHGISKHLLRAADEVELMSAEAVDASVHRVEVPVAQRPVEAPAVRSPVSAVPTPNDLTGRRTPAPPTPASVLAYSGSSSAGTHVMPEYEFPDDSEDHIDAVVRNVVRSFRESATPQDIAALKRERPSIPREIDRALLVDLSNALGNYDLNDGLRFRLRDRFWAVMAEAA